MKQLQQLPGNIMGVLSDNAEGNPVRPARHAPLTAQDMLLLLLLLLLLLPAVFVPQRITQCSPCHPSGQILPSSRCCLSQCTSHDVCYKRRNMQAHQPLVNSAGRPALQVEGSKANVPSWAGSTHQ
jgi:hypothetical protein